MTLPTASIMVKGPHGRGATIAIDGIPIEFSVSHAELVIDVNDVNRLTIEHLVHVDEIEVEAVITFRAVVAMPGQPFSGHRFGEGDTPRMAIENLLAKLP